jgi:hypothetical protein
MRHFAALAVVAGTFVTAAASPVAFDDPERECVDEVRGVRIASSPLRDGIAFVFTVPKPRQVDGLRTLLRNAANLVEQQTHVAALHPDEMPASDGNGAIPALTITVRNTPQGAIVSVRPELALHIPLLHANARDFERYWSSHECVSVPLMANREALHATARVALAQAAASSPRRAAPSTAAGAGSTSRAP